MVFAGGGSDTFTYQIILGVETYEWLYRLSDDGTATVVAAPRTINGRLDVPKHLDAHPVVGIASSAFSNRGDIRELILPEGLTYIDSYAFQNCTNLTELAIPDSVQSMGAGVFGGCTSLEKLTIPFVGTCRGTDGYDRNQYMRAQFGYMFGGGDVDGTRAVEGIRYVNGNNSYTTTYFIPTNLAEVVVTDETLITRNAFAGCEDLKRLTFLGSVANVEDSAFRNCSRLEKAVLPDSVTTLGDYAFYGCANLKSDESEVFPASLVSIGSYAFSGCSDGLFDIVLPEGLVSIGGYAFQSCRAVTNVVVSSMVKNIDQCAFESCTSLTELTIPDSVQSMGAGVFGGCTSLEKLTIPFVGTCRGADGYDRNQYMRAQFGYMFGGGDVDGTRAVEGIRRVNGNNSYTTTYFIPTNLAEVVVTDETLITQNAFAGCEDLKRLTFLGSVANVEDSAFKNCTSLEAVTFFGNRPGFGSNAFSGVPSLCVIRVAKSSSGWGEEIPGTWEERRIEYIADDVLPEVADESAVAESMASFADARVAENVTTIEQYDAFREWACAAKLQNGALGGSKAAMDSPHAWLSYALGADKLIDSEISSDDIHVAAFEVDERDDDAGVPVFTFEVAIDGVNIGKGLVSKETFKENVKKVLGLEGAATLDPHAFSSDNIEITFDAPIDGKARFTVTPPSHSSDTFFMRVKMK